MNTKIMNRIILVFGLILLLSVASIASAKTDYAVKESRNCPYCHASDGPPQLNERGEYYGTNNHSLEGYAPSPTITSTQEPEEEIEIGVHMNVWDVGSIVFFILFFMLILIYVIRL